MRRPRRRLIVAAVALGVIGIGTGLGVALPGDSAPSATDRAATQAFRSGPLQRLINDVGALIVYRIKPALSDLNSGRLTPPRFRAEAAEWRADVVSARMTFESCAAPPLLRPAVALYDDALDRYVQAIAAFDTAAGAPASERQAALHQAAGVASGADTVWDRADARLNQVLHRLGIRTDRPITATGGAGCA